MSDTAATIDLLQAALDRDPADQVTRGVLADVVGETDPVAGEALRWLVEFDHFPYTSPPACKTWVWFDQVWAPDNGSVLPFSLFRRMEKQLFTDTDASAHEYLSRREAESAVIAAYRALGEEEKRELWAREVANVER